MGKKSKSHKYDHMDTQKQNSIVASSKQTITCWNTGSSFHNGYVVFCVYSLNVLSVLISLVGCYRPETAASSQSDSVSRKPIGVGQRPGRIPQPQSDSTRDWAHTQQLCSWFVKLRLYFILKQDEKNIIHILYSPNKLSPALISCPPILSFFA